MDSRLPVSRASPNRDKGFGTLTPRPISTPMLPFSALLLRDYYKSIGWNEDNSYSQLNRSSNGPSSQRSLTAHLTDVVQLFCESNPFPSLTARH